MVVAVAVVVLVVAAPEPADEAAVPPDLLEVSSVFLLLSWLLSELAPWAVGTEPVEELLVAPQASSRGAPSRPGISLLLRRTLLKNFSAVLRSLKVISVEEGVVWMSVNSPMP